ncbi:MAG: DUF2851 family protein [Bacteroidales bacterium]|nr:DUF2851 family protein [Bacteroidales bacterium]
MTEDFLYYIWQFRNYKGELTSTDGSRIKVIKPGLLNTNSGPDFSDARILINDTEWSGSVEMHIKSSDWIKHNHNNNSVYDSVILHVVYEHDMEITTKGGNKLEVVELKGKFNLSQYAKYRDLSASREWIPCSKQIKDVNSLIRISWLERLLIERLEHKTEQIETNLAANNNNWEKTFYIALARNFGFNINSDPFEQLATSTPLNILAKYKNNIFQIEAILFGQSSLINPNLNDEYSTKLLKEYEFLKKKHGLEAVYSYQWKFMRMRPVNFPTIRIAQFAYLINKSSHLFSKILEISNISELKELFNLEVSEYWHNHYVFGKNSKKSTKKFGSSSFDLVLINTIVPFLFVYANHNGDENLKSRALKFLEETKAESNSIIKRFAQSGLIADNAAQSQALLELRNNYCSYTKCLQCGIGISLIR